MNQSNSNKPSSSPWPSVISAIIAAGLIFFFGYLIGNTVGRQEGQASGFKSGIFAHANGRWVVVPMPDGTFQPCAVRENTQSTKNQSYAP